MIRVVANLSWLVPGRVGGSEQYTVRLLRAVRDVAPDDINLGVVASSPLLDAHPDLRDVAVAELGGPMHIRPVRILAESTTVRRATAHADVVHHFGGRVPARRAPRAAHVVTVHDLQPIHLPENFSAAKRAYLRWALPRSVDRATLVMTPSMWVARTVVDEYGVDPARVRAVSSTWDTATDVDDGLAAGLGVGPVVLYPAVTHPHKEHATLIAAVRALAERRPDVRLVLTGGEGRAEAAVTAASRGAPVIRLGRVSAAQLRALLGRADVLAFPSCYEGFGLPVIEAMRARTPVVARTNGAVAEVLDGCGTLVETADPGAWADALDVALAADEATLDAAATRAEHYAPAVAAARLLDAWRVAAGSSTSR
ncbi:MAG: glycosyltransferase family 1 protein [Acidimicrobiales bacterium]|nr:glycosyltransferase family 1 protein [Acidimicrobiales bacterium]